MWPSARSRSSRRRTSPGRRYATSSDTSWRSLSQFWRRPPTTSRNSRHRDRPSQAGGVAPCVSAIVLSPLRPSPMAPAALQVEVAELPAILAAIKAPGAQAVLVNVWATWCEPCREEMPDLVRFYRDHRAQGLRLVLIS